MTGRNHGRDLVCEAAARRRPAADGIGCHEVEKVGRRALFGVQWGRLFLARGDNFLDEPEPAMTSSVAGAPQLVNTRT